MKKFLFGLLLGVTMASATAVYASDTIQAYLFPVNYIINGQSKELGGEFITLNHNGHAYVPVRFVAENMGGFIMYDDTTRTISIDSSSSGVAIRKVISNYRNLYFIPESIKERVESELETPGGVDTFFYDNGKTYVLMKSPDGKSEVNVVALKQDGNQVKIDYFIGSSRSQGSSLSYALGVFEDEVKVVFHPTDFTAQAASRAFISQDEAIRIAKRYDQNPETSWTAKLIEDTKMEINNVDITYSLWVVEAVYPAGNKLIVYLDSVTGREIAMTETEVPSLIYENEKHHFSLELPRSWKGKYVIEEHGQDRGVEPGDIINFFNLANKEKYGGLLFTIYVMLKDEWPVREPQMRGIIGNHLSKLGETGDKVVLLITPTDVQFSIDDKNVADDYHHMFEDIEFIKSTFWTDH